MDIKSTPIDTKGFHTLIQLKDTTIRDSFDLYSGLFLHNRFAVQEENNGLEYKLEQSELQEQLKMQYECSSPAAAMNDIENHIKNLEDQLKEQSEDFSNSLATIKALESHIRGLEDEMEKQAQGFEADLQAVMHDKVEQEQRAIQAEEHIGIYKEVESTKADYEVVQDRSTVEHLKPAASFSGSALLFKRCSSTKFSVALYTVIHKEIFIET